MRYVVPSCTVSPSSGNKNDYPDNMRFNILTFFVYLFVSVCLLLCLFACFFFPICFPVFFCQQIRHTSSVNPGTALRVLDCNVKNDETTQNELHTPHNTPGHSQTKRTVKEQRLASERKRTWKNDISAVKKNLHEINRHFYVQFPLLSSLSHGSSVLPVQARRKNREIQRIALRNSMAVFPAFIEYSLPFSSSTEQLQFPPFNPLSPLTKFFHIPHPPPLPPCPAYIH